MRDVFRTSCQARTTPTTRWSAGIPGGGPRERRRPGYVTPALVAAVLAVLALRILADLVGRLDAGDPVALLVLGLGAGGVMVTLVPFAILFAARARRAWGAATDQDGEGRALMLRRPWSTS